MAAARPLPEAPRVPAAEGPLRLVTWNIHRGLSTWRKRDVLARISDALNAIPADVVCLQEVWQHPGVTEHQLEALSAEVWRHGAFGRNAVFPDGAQGNALLSRLPIRTWENLDVSVPGQEPRGLLVAELEGPGARPLTVVCAHLGLRAPERLLQVARLGTVLARIPAEQPVLVAGDFNDWRGTLRSALEDGLGLREVFRELHGRPARSFPALFPLFRLDRIYHRGGRVLAAERLRPRHSDHRPLRATFEL